MNPEVATSWLKFARELTATILIWAFATYSGYSLVRNAESWMPQVATALAHHIENDGKLLTNTEEQTRIAMVSCKTLKKLTKDPDTRECDIKKVILGNTVISP